MSNLDQIRDQQRETWDRFSSGWKKWDKMVQRWLAPFGNAMIRHANLREDSRVLDVAAGTGEPGLTAAALVPHGLVTVTGPLRTDAGRRCGDRSSPRRA